MSNDTFNPEDSGQGGKNALIIVVIIVILLLIGSIYAVFNKQGNNNEATVDETSLEEDVLATSTELTDIDKDLDNLEASINQIEAE